MNGTLDPDQTPRFVASDLGLHCQSSGSTLLAQACLSEDLWQIPYISENSDGSDQDFVLHITRGPISHGEHPLWGIILEGGPV